MQCPNCNYVNEQNSVKCIRCNASLELYKMCSSCSGCNKKPDFGLLKKAVKSRFYKRQGC